MRLFLYFRSIIQKFYVNKLSKYLIIAGGAAIILLLAWYFKTILLYIVIAGILTIIGRPIANVLSKIHIKKFHVPRWLAAIVTLILLICIILSLFLLVSPMIGQIAHLINAIDIKSLSSQVYEPLQKFNAFIIKTIPSIGPDFRLEIWILDYVKDFINLSTFSTVITSITSFVVDFAIALFSIIFISFFMLMEKGLITNVITALLADKYEQHIKRATTSINTLLTRYFVGITIESLCISILNSLGLIFIAKMDMQLAIVVALASGLLNIIPYVGPLVGDLLAILMGLIYHINKGITMPLILFLLIILAIFIVTQLIDNYVFQPVIYSSSVKAHPLEIFFVILIAGQIGGVFGILIAIPTYTAIRVIASEFLPQFKFVRKLTKNIRNDSNKNNPESS